MANKVKIVLNSAGVRQLLQSATAQAITEQYAEQYVAEHGGTFENTQVGRYRVRASVERSKRKK